MRFFRHGDSLAIVLPEKLRQSASVKENDEFEFFELSLGLFALVEKRQLEERVKKNVFTELLSRLSEEAPRSASIVAPVRSPTPPVQSNESAEETLKKQGFFVIPNETEARRLSQILEQQIKGKRIFGVRGFDRKFYLVSETYLHQWSSNVLQALGEDAVPLPTLASQLKMEEVGCLAVLQVMKEHGDVIEKKRGIFKAVL
ncbi:hypothetical protein KJ765_01525 [Candidatus Micrarchaeota archaeon]|nr:hypothetical protein [Candidatus Micrarchaeota archaeon]